MTRRVQTSLWHNDSGATAALYALALPALVAIAGIGFDYAHVAAMDTELQNAADQAALAAATQLDRSAGSMDRATAAAQGGLVSNETLFANDGGARAVDVLSVTFYEDQADAEACNGDTADEDSQAAFVCVTVETRTANYALTPVVGVFSGSLAAQAVAGMGSATCRTPPLMICNPDEPSGGSVTADFNADAYRGRGLLAQQGGGGAWTPGNFGYLDIGLANGAVGVRQALGWTAPPGSCIATFGGVDTVDTQTGNISNAPQAYNTRFDMYDTPGCESGGVCPASINSRKDVLRASNANGGNSCKYHNQGWQLPANQADRYEPTSATEPITNTPLTMGHPRDMCHAISPNGSCASGPIGNGTWDRDAYFRVHYLRGNGTRWNATDWRTNTGLSSNATRYEVYQWEIDNRGSTIDGVVILGSKPATHSGNTPVNHATPVCSSSQGYGGGVVPTENTADRRRFSVAVINCRAHNVRGNSRNVPVRRWMDVFLVQPSLNRGTGGNQRTRQDQIYVEIIGITDAGSEGETAGSVIRRDVPFLIR